MNFWNHENRQSISDFRKHGLQHFEKPTDRTAPFSHSKNFENYGMLVHMLWLINLNKNLALIWSLRPPLDSLIYFGKSLEYVTYQFWSKNYQLKQYLNNRNQLLDSVDIFCGSLQFLTLAIRLPKLSLATKFKMDPYLLSSAQLKQVEKISSVQNNRMEKERSGGPLAPTFFRSAPALRACVSSADTSTPLRLSSTFYVNHLNQHGCQNSFELLCAPSMPVFP